AGPVQSRDIDVGVECTAFEHQIAAGRDFGRHAEYRLIEDHAVEGEVLKTHGYRQFWQGEGTRLGRRQPRSRRRRDAVPVPGDLSDMQPVDLQAGAQQLRAAPVDLDVLDDHPGALVV